MTKLCLKGTRFIWMQCDSSLFDEGEECMKQAFLYGDKDSKYYLGLLYSLKDSPFGFNLDKAKRYLLDAAKDKNSLAILEAFICGCYDNSFDAESGMNLSTAVQKTIYLAETGDIFAAWQMARYLEEKDENNDEDKEQIVHYYEMAAEGGIVAAMVYLGKCYENGHLVERDLEKSDDYAYRTAALGHVWGLKKIGLGARLAGDYEAAVQYLQAAAIQGDDEAPLLVARMYLQGTGCSRDVMTAIRFLEMAAERDDTRSYFELGELFYRDSLVEKDNEKAFYWYSRAYDAGEKRASGPLGRLYLLAGPNHDEEKGYSLLMEAADAPDIDTMGNACLVLGNYFRGGEESHMKEEAISWYEKGARRGNPECMEILGNMFFQGEEGADADYEKSFYWFSKCEEAGTLQSPARLGYLYLKGQGCEENEQKAIELFERASLHEKDGNALYELGFVYERKGTKEDLEKAARYYEDAVNKGNESAKHRLSHFRRGLFGGWKVV